MTAGYYAWAVGVARGARPDPFEGGLQVVATMAWIAAGALVGLLFVVLGALLRWLGGRRAAPATLR